MEGKTRLICEVHANPKLVDFMWMLNNATLTTDIVHMGLQSVLTIDGPAPTSGIYYCHANNSVGFGTPCEISVEGIDCFIAFFFSCLFKYTCVSTNKRNTGSSMIGK